MAHQPFLLLVLVVCGMTLLLASCSKSNSALVGKWKGKTDGSLAEFHADGTFAMGDSQDRMMGKYTVSGSDSIKLELDGPVGKAVGPMVGKFVVQGDSLDITSPEGEVEHFQRVK